jgi:hypothetical protein
LEVLEGRVLPSILTVTNNADSGAGSMRAAIAAAVSGDTINFDASLVGQTITLTSGELDITQSINILGLGANNLTISGGGMNEVFAIGRLGSNASSVSLSGLTIADGYELLIGGGIINFGGTLTVSNCTLSGNSANAGGGIANEPAGTLTVSNCTLSGNSATSRTGSGQGNGIGGGILNYGTLIASYCTLSGNSATGEGADGGGITNDGGNSTVSNCTLSSNSTTGDGGGIFNLGGILSLSNCTVSGNSAFDGGGISNEPLTSTQVSSLSLSNSTVASNTAGVGGGIDNFSGNGMDAQNTIIANNNATSSAPDISGDLTEDIVGHNLIGNTSGGSGFVASDLRNLNPLLGILQNNGGTNPTPTMALLPGSPAIDAGDNTGAPATDQRGFPRIVNVTVDIGAFESRGFTITVASGNNQQATVNTAFASPLSATVSSPFGEPVQGGVVTFTAPSSGASATFPSGNMATIGPSGQASVAASANSVEGNYAVTASGRGATIPASFNLTNGAVINLSPTTLPHATAGVAYSQTLTANGGSGPYTFVLTAGALPAGFTLSSSGLLTGTNTQAATFNFTVKATDSGGFSGSQAYTLTVDPASTATFVIVGPSSVAHGTTFSITVEAVDAFGNITTGFRGSVNFSSSENSAVLPGKYTFTASDNGVHTFTGLVLRKTGVAQTITVFDITNKSIEGSLLFDVT